MQINHWNHPSEMSAPIRSKAKHAGMWEDDIDDIWFVPDGVDIPDEIEEICKYHGGAVQFKTDNGMFFVNYHS